MSAPTLKLLSLRGQANLHRSRRPLDEAPIDRVTAHEWSGRQGNTFDAVADAELENGELGGCSPWSCRSGASTADGPDLGRELPPSPSSFRSLYVPEHLVPVGHPLRSPCRLVCSAARRPVVAGLRQRLRPLN
ncbi:hypothetical protein [Streptomyces sp. H39-S7]|uniref:hypothetical protein n=1 Tax=Streptomyces sp. H39-S7 TaxID=3004357 RepID=UPI0022AF89D0|nr:hypothetical protein [Streptomyces sp. H39-S7]MCZ4122699.1 hypothetical protein [Streptomyces sp. H39-S7]